MPTGPRKQGRLPKNQAVLKRATFLGGFEYLRADYVQQDFPRHVHEEYLLGYIETGVHSVWCQGGWWHASSDVVATFAPDEAHFGGAGDDNGWRQTIFYLPEAMVHNILDIPDFKPPATVSFHDPFQYLPDVATGLKRLSVLLDSDADELLVEQELYQVISDALKRTGAIAQDERRGAPEPLASVADYIQDNIKESLDLTELSLLAGCTKRQFIERFRKQFDMPPYQYVMQCRVRRARDLLRSGTDIADAATEAGFADQSHLTRNFRSLYGVTPARFIDR